MLPYVILCTLESGIDIGGGINVVFGTFGKNDNVATPNIEVAQE